MKLLVTGCKPLQLPQGTIPRETGKFDSKTSYASKLITRLNKRGYRETTLPSKLDCLQKLKARAQALGGYRSYFEPLAGVGLSVRVFEPEGTLWLNDLDPSCNAMLRLNFPKAKVTAEDAFLMDYPKADLVFLDFNDYTYKRYLSTHYAAALAGAFAKARSFVVLNDCTPFYFRYGASSFAVYSKVLGRPLASVDDYFRAVAERYGKTYADWKLVHVAHFRDSSFQLFYRGKAKFHTEAVVKPTVTVSMGV